MRAKQKIVQGHLVQKPLLSFQNFKIKSADNHSGHNLMLGEILKRQLDIKTAVHYYSDLKRNSLFLINYGSSPLT